MTDDLRVGVLAFQGAIAEHVSRLHKAFDAIKDTECLRGLELKVVEVRRPGDLGGLHGLILPGGQSTTIGKFLDRDKFKESLDVWLKGTGSSRPFVWGTCAGLILLADRLEDQKQGGQTTIGGLDITASRSVRGLKVVGFESYLNIKNDLLASDLGRSQGASPFLGIFLNPPSIISVEGKDVRVMATLPLKDKPDRIVAVEQENLLATAFHPELTTDDTRWHGYFLLRSSAHRQAGLNDQAMPSVSNPTTS